MSLRECARCGTEAEYQKGEVDKSIRSHNNGDWIRIPVTRMPKTGIPIALVPASLFRDRHSRFRTSCQLWTTEKILLTWRLMQKLASEPLPTARLPRRSSHPTSSDVSKNSKHSQVRKRPAPLQSLRHARFHDCPIWQNDDEVHLPQWSFSGVRKADEPKWDGLCPELLRFACADLYVIKSGHKVSGNLCHLFFAHGLWYIRSIGLENVLQCTSILSRTSIPKQLNGFRRYGQHEGKKKCREALHGQSLQ